MMSCFCLERLNKKAFQVTGGDKRFFLLLKGKKKVPTKEGFLVTILLANNTFFQEALLRNKTYIASVTMNHCNDFI